MATEREIQEVVARCVSIMVCYHNEKTPGSREIMVAEVRTVAGRVAEMGLGDDEADTGVLRPVGHELLLRYGHEVGPRISAEFLDAFEHPDGKAGGRAPRRA